MKTITVKVTQDDIANGKQGECNFCPIALALNRHAPANHHFVVGTKFVSLHRSEHDESYVVESVALPRAAEAFVCLFDRRYTVEPFTFDLTFQRL